MHESGAAEKRNFEAQPESCEPFFSLSLKLSTGSRADPWPPAEAGTHQAPPLGEKGLFQEAEMFPSLEVVFENRMDEQQSRIAQLQLILPLAREAKLMILYDFFHSYDSVV